MLLAIDIGNTNTVFGIYKKSILIASFRLTTSLNITSDELGLEIFQHYSYLGIDIKSTKDIIVSSVVPSIMHTLSNSLLKFFGRMPLVVGENIQVPIKNLYDNPKEVGVDRLVNSYCAIKKYGYPIIAVDIGTATTFDAINSSGEYMGGAIFPGIITSMEGLFTKTAKLPRVDISMPKNAIGKNTVESIQSGAVRGYIGALEGLINSIKIEMNSNPKIIATGGMGRMMAQYTDIINIVDVNLTLDGLYMIYQNYISENN